MKIECGEICCGDVNWIELIHNHVQLGKFKFRVLSQEIIWKLGLLLWFGKLWQ